MVIFMIMSTARDYIRPECVETYLPLIRALIAETRKESGCLQYDLFRDIENEGQFVLLERWENAECLEQHLSSPHFSKIVPQIQQLQTQPSVVNCYAPAEISS